MDHPLSDARRAELYKAHRERHQVVLKRKHLAQYDHEFAALTGADPSQAVLEIGCGTGLFLRYLEARGYGGIVGVDMDENLSGALADLTRAEIYLDDIAAVLDGPLKGRTFERIVLLDVAEHLRLDVLVALLARLRGHVRPGGRMLLRVPNVESPWGLKMFFGSFDHVTPLTPGRMGELGVMSGWTCTGVFPQHPGRWDRRLKERLLNGVLGALLSYRPDIWTANLLAVYEPAAASPTP